MAEEKKKKIGDKVAEQEFKRFGELNHRDFDESVMDADDLQEFKNLKRRFIKNVIAGHLVVNEKGLPEYTPYASKDIPADTVFKFKPLKGKHLANMDRLKKNQDVARQNMLMATVTGTNSNLIGELDWVDYKFLSDLVTLFLDA